MKTFGFEKLKVWEKSSRLSQEIYLETNRFPDNERFGLVSQMRPCAISISSHLAEGSGRHTAKDKARFTEIAYGSALELVNQIILSHDLGFISQEKYNQSRQTISEITAMLDGLRKSQLNS